MGIFFIIYITKYINHSKEIFFWTASESADNDIKKVCRNLFDLSDGAAPKPKLQRSMTVGSVPVAELRRSPRKKHRKSTAITPRKSRMLMKSSKGSHKTPVKGMRTAEKGMKTPKSKKGICNILLLGTFYCYNIPISF